MSRLFEALSGLKTEHRSAVAMPSILVAPSAVAAAPQEQEPTPDHYPLKLVSPTVPPPDTLPQESAQPEELSAGAVQHAEAVEYPEIVLDVSPESRLVALTDPNGLGAEKFRALVTRLDHLRKQRELKSLQVTSSVVDEGKTLVAANLAITLAKYSGARTLLVEGDLHRPTLAYLLGVNGVFGVNDWWTRGNQEIEAFVYRLSGIPLSFLPAGNPFDQPSDLLRSARFMNAFAQLVSQFDWIIVDSTPMLPIVDVNLWSRLLDGTLLVVREGVAPVKALRSGLKALNQPKLIGVVVNEAMEFDNASYQDQYYGVVKAKDSLPIINNKTVSRLASRAAMFARNIKTGNRVRRSGSAQSVSESKSPNRKPEL